VAQGYRIRPRPPWLIEGTCDSVWFFKWEPGNLGRIDPATPRYDKGYRVTAAFLAYLVERYDKDLVRHLNRALREGRHDEDLFRQLTGKTVRELDEEWRATLRRWMTSKLARPGDVDWGGRERLLRRPRQMRPSSGSGVAA
jgi:hypothetical protein